MAVERVQVEPGNSGLPHLAQPQPSQCPESLRQARGGGPPDPRKLKSRRLQSPAMQGLGHQEPCLPVRGHIAGQWQVGASWEPPYLPSNCPPEEPSAPAWDIRCSSASLHQSPAATLCTPAALPQVLGARESPTCPLLLGGGGEQGCPEQRLCKWSEAMTWPGGTLNVRAG